MWETAMPKFEIGIYNQAVIDLQKQGKFHRELDDSWAEVRYIELDAPNAQEAKRKAQVRYPVTKGFVITAVDEVQRD
ncbi:MAG: hypothetical protein EAZ99_14155 [Alphaproteobacteria bacterium]|nr:MAG: hypothetical protein EAZ99_14155 [Alphaproteobacteria bacterium]